MAIGAVMIASAGIVGNGDCDLGHDRRAHLYDDLYDAGLIAAFVLGQVGNRIGLIVGDDPAAVFVHCNKDFAVHEGG